ncbi:MAG TPA: sensor domain-containing diguanylate cyclase [Candidatus Limnocylindria bacterium]
MTDAVHTGRVARAGIPPLLASFDALRARVSVLARQRALLESAAILLPIVIIGVTHAVGPALWLVACAYLIASAVIIIKMPIAGVARSSTATWMAGRLLLAVAMVAAGQLLTGVTGLLAVVYLPVVALSAFAGTRPLLVASMAAIGAHLLAETVDRGTVIEAIQRGAGFSGAVVLVGLGTRREVLRMQRARDRLRRAVTGDRRRARQIAGVEAIGRILATNGPTPEALERVVGRIATEFAYRYVTIYLGDERHVSLGAQHGYSQVYPEFDAQEGIVGRVMRTRQPAFVPRVASDPDYRGFDADVVSEICVPMLAEEAFLGFINVESTTESELDATDLRVMIAVADRLAASLIIGRERQRLGERAEVFRQLHSFSEAVNGTLEADALYRAIVRSLSTVVTSDLASLHILDRESGRYLLRAVEGGDGLALGAEVRSGEGTSGRAIRNRTMVIDDAVPRPARRSAIEAAIGDGGDGPMLAASVPLVRDGAVLGALTLMRSDRAHRFTGLERDALAMIGEQAALAVANVFLHAEVAELALRDPLTGLFNRRYLDPAMEQLFARRARVPAEERVPLAAIMFDLDHFSDLNNRHGHQAGDDVLRAFGAVLRSRMRSTDLVARFGGEEFAAILYRASLDDAVRIADEVREQLAATPVLGMSGEELSATVSAGCAALDPQQESGTELLRAADVALYMAKRAGRDRVCAA